MLEIIPLTKIRKLNLKGLNKMVLIGIIIKIRIEINSINYVFLKIIKNLSTSQRS